MGKDEYAPTDFTHPDVAKAGGDVDALDPRQTDVSKRHSIATGADVVVAPQSGRPLNPLGRTGLSGRGSLPRWGPNLAVSAVVTRFDPSEAVEAERALEVLVLSTSETAELRLPEAWTTLESGTRFPPPLIATLTGSEKDAATEAPQAWLSSVSASAPVVAEGYADGDARSTDNAWVETRCVHVHVPWGSPMAARVGLAAGGGAGPTKWIEVSDDAPDFRALAAPHRRVVVAALGKNPGLFYAALARVATDANSLAAMVAHDLDRRIEQWSKRVEAESRALHEERAALAKERAALEADKQKTAQTRADLAEGAAYLERVLTETLSAKRELQTRLDATPLDLDAEQLKQEWQIIEQEKLMLAKASRALEAAMDRLADAHAAMDVAVGTAHEGGVSVQLPGGGGGADDDVVL